MNTRYIHTENLNSEPKIDVWGLIIFNTPTEYNVKMLLIRYRFYYYLSPKQAKMLSVYSFDSKGRIIDYVRDVGSKKEIKLNSIEDQLAQEAFKLVFNSQSKR